MAENPCIMGIDPGVSGAIAFYFPAYANVISAEDVPVTGNDIDAVTLALRIEQMRPDMCVIEAVGAMPGQGVSSTFKFGCSYGIVRGVVLAQKVPLHFVSPGRWKKYFGLIGEDKDASRKKAQHLWPSSDHFGRKKDHGRAEAALLARYGAETIWRRGEAA